jgi:hypothetical protein
VWNGDQVTRELDAFLAPRVREAALHLTGYIRANLATNVGSVVPFVASQPDQWPFLWDGTLRDSVQYVPGPTPLIAYVVSDAVDQHVHPGYHFSHDEEFGHRWDGWAWDWQTGRVVKVAPEHEVEARSFMRRGLAEDTAAVVDILTGGTGGGMGVAA